MGLKNLSISFLFVALLVSCQTGTMKNNVNDEAIIQEQLTVYETDNLIINKLSEHVYQHISFLNTNSFGKVDCNGMFVVNQNEAVVFDTPADNESSEELIKFITGILKVKIKAIIPTHFHEDCVGGLEKFISSNVPAFAFNKTINLLKQRGHQFSVPFQEFNERLVMDIGDKKIYAEYFGEGHTLDNIIAYFPQDKALFGGCLIKALSASKGNLADANLSEWSVTVRKLKQKYPETEMVIPGHGKTGNAELLDYTITLFEQ